ncbi:MAG: hypothetical protein NVS9B13_03120 [Candidatus Acidiferrum sp.]
MLRGKRAENVLKLIFSEAVKLAGALSGSIEQNISWLSTGDLKIPEIPEHFACRGRHNRTSLNTAVQRIASKSRIVLPDPV